MLVSKRLIYPVLNTLWNELSWHRNDISQVRWNWAIVTSHPLYIPRPKPCAPFDDTCFAASVNVRTGLSLKSFTFYLFFKDLHNKHREQWPKVSLARTSTRKVKQGLTARLTWSCTRPTHTSPWWVTQLLPAIFHDIVRNDVFCLIDIIQK